MYLTPLEESRDLAEALGVERMFLKREDQTPTGSFKYRSALRQIEDMVEHGERAGVVSSSGNAAISLAHEAKAQGVTLFAFVPPNLSSAKTAALLAYDPVVIQSTRAMRLANYLAAHYRIRNLRPSIDDRAVLGFVPLGEELAEQVEEYGGVDVIVSFCTSGASMLGMCRGYRAEPRPKFFAARNLSVGCYGIEKSPRLADVADVAELVDVSDDAVERTQKLLTRAGICVAREAAASLAIVLERQLNGRILWIVSGKDWGVGTMNPQAANLYRAETFEDVDRIYAEHARV
ncbi:PLP-dependent lyase/thiolase [Candidatus Uhrbacteria bacterium]|nr:PLP-dependent lyase/thiolase [Candidatus Uhrbacteria bacterium]